ncbi:ribosome biogenesis GTPase A [Kushneria sinocarnis]|uniref:Ribosome biogenesis GTPase A n=1 Tax=Kushneria sinocarnis TaxID=595502 RepID=A0A420WTJ0_9GAMM|nr:ribosome biogenesis GTPase YlqF [Kushneria sinocarnis]RKQ96365.1 ribosome biogenesis GTPase A [Kushneria sinocarnis]
MLGWYPGHMHKARRQINETLPEIDVVIEVLDARLPYSSSNPMLAELVRHKPTLKILTRADLADPAQTRVWTEHFNARGDTRALAVVTTEGRQLKRIAGLCRELAGHVRTDRDVRVMVMGIPNVGKSTLINGLAGRVIAKVGNEPAVTKRQQKIRIAGGVALTDTPGVLWPRIEDQASAYRLAASGAIRDTALEYTDVATTIALELKSRYPQALKQRYRLETLGATGEEIVTAIAAKRGGLRSGGEVDLHRGAEVLLMDLRGGKLGRLTLETPDDIVPPEVLAERRAAEQHGSTDERSDA